MATVGTLARYLDDFAPPLFAEEWDNVGLLLGDPAAHVANVMTCLTVTPETVAEAVAEGAELIVSHHPILFKPVRRLTSAMLEGRLLLPLIRAGIAVYSPHTAFDNCRDGINDLLARRFGLANARPLKPFMELPKVKLIIFVPDGDLARVSDAAFQAGAGVIGHYRECSFRVAGLGTFHGGADANPTVGQKGRREEVNEWRLEMVCPVAQLDAVIGAVRRAHSYEEPAFDVVPLQRLSARDVGAGRIGHLQKACTLAELAEHVAQVLQVPAVEVVGSGSRAVACVAVVCGAGDSFLGDAARAGAEVLVTGEMRFHDQLAANATGVGVILPGHFATERPGVVALAERLAQAFPGLRVWPAAREIDPTWRRTPKA